MNEKWDSREFRGWLGRKMAGRDWRAADLARALPANSSVISKWLAGKARPSSRSCDLLADVFHEAPDVVLSLAGHRPPDYPADPEMEAYVAKLRRVRLNDASRMLLDVFFETEARLAGPARSSEESPTERRVAGSR